LNLPKRLCNPNEMYDKLFKIVRNRFWKQHTRHRKSLDPSLRLAATLRHLDSGVNYFRHALLLTLRNNPRIAVREVSNGKCEEYVDELITTP